MEKMETPATPPPFAGFWIRLAATCLDWIALQCATWLIELLVIGALFWVRFLLKRSDPAMGFWEEFDSMEAQFIEAIIYIALSFPYFAWANARYGTTLGKWPLRLYVVQANGLKRITLRQSITRWASYLLSYLPVGAGFLMVAFHPERRGLHDLIAGTVVIRRPKSVAVAVD